MTLLDDYPIRCEREAKRCGINIEIEEAKKQLWYEFGNILLEIRNEQKKLEGKTK